MLAKHGGITTGPADEDWYWTSLALLDHQYYPSVRKWLAREDEQDGWASLVEGTTEDTDSRFADHVEGFLAVIVGKASLGRQSSPSSR